MTRNITALVVGLIFALGLGLGGMLQPAKVIGFLDFFGTWDPSLVFVMGGAAGTYFIAFRLITKRKQPILAGRFSLPTRRDLTAPLVAGSALFGIGWGLAGYCPGPGIASLGTGGADALMFVMSMTVGMALHRAYDAYREQVKDRAEPAKSVSTVALAAESGEHLSRHQALNMPVL